MLLDVINEKGLADNNSAPFSPFGVVSWCVSTLSSQIDVERIAWPNPRRVLVDLVGKDNQGIPLLVLADKQGVHS
jgi:hypothetical protein